MGLPENRPWWPSRPSSPRGIFVDNVSLNIQAIWYKLRLAYALGEVKLISNARVNYVTVASCFIFCVGTNVHTYHNVVTDIIVLNGMI